MCFLNELYFAFISHLFFRLDIGGFSSAAKMHLALKKIFPVLVPSRWVAETARHQTAMETVTTSSCSCSAAEKEMQLATAAERKHTRWNHRLPRPSAEREPVREPGLRGGRSETCLRETLIKPSPLPSGPLSSTPSLSVQQQGQQEHVCQVVCPQARLDLGCPRVPWPWHVPSLCPDPAAQSVETPCSRAWHPAPAPCPPLLPGIPWANPASPKAGAAALRKRWGVLQEEDLWINADRSPLKARGRFPSPEETKLI